MDCPYILTVESTELPNVYLDINNGLEMAQVPNYIY